MTTSTACVHSSLEASNTPFIDNGVNRYLKEIGRCQLLSREETDRLTMLVYDKGDSVAGSKLIVGNLRLVVKVVMNFQKYWMNNFLDLIQEGNIGLAKAVKKFDPDRGVKFSSYAAYWIRAYILKFIMDNCRLVKIGTTQSQRKLFYKLNKEKKFLEAQGITPDPKMLSKRLEVKESEVVEMGNRLDNYDLSLEAPVWSGSDFEQKMFLPSGAMGVEENVAEQEFKEWFSRTMEKFKEKLSRREQVILTERLLSDDPRTLNDIAGQFNISRERVRQIETGLMGKLKEKLEKEID